MSSEYQFGLFPVLKALPLSLPWGVVVDTGFTTFLKWFFAEHPFVRLQSLRSVLICQHTECGNTQPVKVDMFACGSELCGVVFWINTSYQFGSDWASLFVCSVDDNPHKLAFDRLWLSIMIIDCILPHFGDQYEITIHHSNFDVLWSLIFIVEWQMNFDLHLTIICWIPCRYTSISI